MEANIKKIVDAICEKDVPLFMAILTSPKFPNEWKIYPNDPEHASYDTDMTSWVNTEISTLLSCFKSKKLKTIKTSCSQEYCGKEHSFYIFYSKEDKLCFPAKIGYNKETGYSFDTCDGIIVPSTLKDFKRLKIEDAWKITSFHCTDGGESLLDSFDL